MQGQATPFSEIHEIYIRFEKRAMKKEGIKHIKIRFFLKRFYQIEAIHGSDQIRFQQSVNFVMGKK